MESSAKEWFLSLVYSLSVSQGTNVTVGKGVGVVVCTGAHTAIGDISKGLEEEQDKKTPLKIKIEEFGDSLCRVIMIICILVWVINWSHFNDPIHGGSW